MQIIVKVSNVAKWWRKIKTLIRLWICNLKTTIIQSKHRQYGFIVQSILYIIAIFMDQRKKLLVHRRCQSFEVIWWNVFGSSQNGIPEVILGSVLPPTGVKLSFQDAPQIFDGIQIWRTGCPLHNFPMPRKNTLQIFGGKPCSMRRGIIMHEYHLFPEWQILLLVSGYEVFLNEVNVEFGSHFHSISNSKWSYQLVSTDCRSKHHTTTTLLTPDPVGMWTLLAKPSSPPSIGSIKGRSTLVGEQNCLKIDFHVIFCPLHPLFLVDIL